MERPPLAREVLSRAPGRARATSAFSARSGALLAVASAAAGGVLLVLYDHLSQTASLTADSANAVLQGQSIADGNHLLSGWTLSGASFFVTDLPFYAAFAALRGVSPDVAHEVGALIYTLLVLAACFLARGSARGLPSLGRMAVTLVLLLAPAPGEAVQLLLLGPFHAGTTLALLVAFLVLDAAGERVLGACAVGVLLTLAVLSDALALYVGVLPIAVVAGFRLWTGRAGGRAARRPDAALLAAALSSIPVSLLLGRAISALGGFATVPLQASVARPEDLPRNAALALEGALLLFGANFFGRPLTSPANLGVVVHLFGLAFVLTTCGWVVQSWRRGREADRVSRVLLVAMALDVAAYLFSNQAIDLMTSRYLIPFLTFGAVLAGRVGSDRLWRSRLRGAAAAVGLAYFALFGASLRTPPASSAEAELSAFLEQRNLRYGVAAYWQASTVTVQSGGRVRVRAVRDGPPEPSAYVWEAEGSWYDPARAGNDARFVLRDSRDPRSVDRGAMVARFGKPVEDYWFGRYEVLVWDHNLLDQLIR